MRNNPTVTNQEYRLEEDDVLISRSDLNGVITFANPALIAVSGYSHAELIGAPHSLMRHPDMPSGLFEDMWKTLKAGHTWQGILKNRCKNGSFYWVQATVAPLRDADRVVGYTSVRRRASEKDIRRAERVYAAMLHKGKVRGIKVKKGLSSALAWRDGWGVSASPVCRPS
ncbi:PAS domain-containing protein [Vreelandella azerica]|uniref:PAS domain-containing protein n=1 Tax=Vreelandella azerica TaxID=2732867 RepID=UPI001F3C99BA|nr:PAS domain-containing protein [Halomonas azerica]